MKIFRRSMVLALCMLFLCQAAVLAAGKIALQGVRLGKGAARDRVVFDLASLPKYQLNVSPDGKKVTLDFTDVRDVRMNLTEIKSDTIRGTAVQEKDGHLLVTIDLYDKYKVQAGSLKNPARVYLDISKEYENIYTDQVAAGLEHIKYVRADGRGMLTANFLKVDPKLYKLEFALANGIVPGRQTVSGIVADNQAAAGINAAYFSLSGEVIGMMRLDGTVVGTTYFNRSALGLRQDGTGFIDRITYNGQVTLGKVTLPVAGVNVERGANNLIIYNRYYGPTTKTNEYGTEYVIENGRVVAIGRGNARIPQNGAVISVHGTSEDAFKGVKVGDKAVISEDLGAKWQDVPNILGAGPTLVKNGIASPTTVSEQFGPDVAAGRAPRTAFGFTKDGQYLLAVVDGRQSLSIGCTLPEMAALMKKFGAKDALNYDGGGSTEMVLNGTILNSPSDGSERRVGSALLVKRK